jgi:hypothetical protein
MRPNDQIVTALLSSKANPASQADACAWSACCTVLSLHGHVAFGYGFLLAIAEQFVRSISSRLLLARLYTSSGSRLSMAHKSTTPSAGDQALSGVRHGCRDSVGRPTGSAGGKRDFLAFWLVRISTAVRLPAMSIRQEHTSRVVAILTQ